MKRFYILWALPRSGSTPVAQILGYYLNRAHGFVPLGEYFNLHFRGIIQEDRRLRVDDTQWLPEGQQPPEKGTHLLWEKEWRVQALKQAEGRYFMKVQPRHLLWGLRPRVLREAELIFLERENVYENLLSHLVSSDTQQYYQAQGIRAEKGSIIATKDSFDTFLSSFKDFQALRKRYSSARRITYESFLKSSPQQLIDRLGFKKKVDWSSLTLAEKQNPGPKEVLFKNIDQVNAWYRSSPLVRYHPI